MTNLASIEKHNASIDRLIDDLKRDLNKPHLAESARQQIKALKAMRQSVSA